MGSRRRSRYAPRRGGGRGVKLDRPPTAAGGAAAMATVAVGTTMLSKRHATAKAAQLCGGWDELRAVLHTERASREATKAKFRFNEVHSFCALMVKNALQG